MIGIGNNQLMRLTNNFISNPWDITGSIFVSNIFLTSVGTVQQGLFISPNGLKLYVVDRYEDRIYECDLSIAWDTSTATFLRYIASSQDNTPYGIHFNTSGTKMYILGLTNSRIYEYTLSTAWNISTASASTSFLFSTKVTTGIGLTFNNDGTKMYIADYASPYDVTQYNLSTAWSVTTATFVNQKSISAQDSSIRSMYMSPNGVYFFFAGLSTSKIFKYTLSTPYLISSATYDSFKSIPVTVGQLISVYFKEDGTKMYTLKTSSGGLDEYNL